MIVLDIRVWNASLLLKTIEHINVSGSKDRWRADQRGQTNTPVTYRNNTLCLGPL